MYVYVKTTHDVYPLLLMYFYIRDGVTCTKPKSTNLAPKEANALALQYIQYSSRGLFRREPSPVGRAAARVWSSRLS